MPICPNELRYGANLGILRRHIAVEPTPARRVCKLLFTLGNHHQAAGADLLLHRRADIPMAGSRSAAKSKEDAMIVTDIIIRGDQKLNALIVHSTKNELGLETADAIKKKADTAVGLEIARASTYAELIGILNKANPFTVFVLIAHGDKATHSAWLCADLDDDGRELALGFAEQTTLRAYLKDKVCVFGVCRFGAKTLADAIVGHDGAVFALAAHPGNTLRGPDVATAAASLLNAMQHSKPSAVTLDLLVKHCVPQIEPTILAQMVQFPS